jgi:acetyl-CoA carboxylase biotin carboxylase subunit
MKKAGVPVLPGSDGPLQGEDQALKVAKELGYPVIIKAVAGGGGRGMRIVRSGDELAKSVKTAQREAEAAFGVGDVYLEKYVESPRHIEVQVLGDHHGHVIHLGERECSIQRRHQKLLEEAPSVALTDKQRRRLGSTVVEAARAVQYTNAGTFEFLLDREGHFYFLEVNTRLQVEHPVTEFVTGRRHRQGTNPHRGRTSAVGEAERYRGARTLDRVPVNAEDPETFTPSPGVIHAFSVPAARRPRRYVRALGVHGVAVLRLADRQDHHVRRDRPEAIARMRRTLEMTVVDGIKTSIPLHLKILADPDFIAGRLSTSFMERYMPEPKKAGGSLAESA